jgi:hypothetical protein
MAEAIDILLGDDEFVVEDFDHGYRSIGLRERAIGLRERAIGLRKRASVINTIL